VKQRCGEGQRRDVWFGHVVLRCTWGGGGGRAGGRRGRRMGEGGRG
jgi:hypothetical protein